MKRLDPSSQVGHRLKGGLLGVGRSRDIKGLPCRGSLPLFGLEG